MVVGSIATNYGVCLTSSGKPFLSMSTEYCDRFETYEAAIEAAKRAINSMKEERLDSRIVSFEEVVGP